MSQGVDVHDRSMTRQEMRWLLGESQAVCPMCASLSPPISKQGSLQTPKVQGRRTARHDTTRHTPSHPRAVDRFEISSDHAAARSGQGEKRERDTDKTRQAPHRLSSARRCRNEGMGTVLYTHHTTGNQIIPSRPYDVCMCCWAPCRWSHSRDSQRDIWTPYRLAPVAVLPLPDSTVETHSY